MNYIPNKYIEKKDITEIILFKRNGEERARIIIDTKDVVIVNQYQWYLTSPGNYPVCNRRGAVYLHHLIQGRENKRKKKILTDHIDRNPLNNRKSNLRDVSPGDNCRNTNLQRNNTSGYKGVSWYKNSNKWLSYIDIQSKRICLGYFSVKEKAIEARKQAENFYLQGGLLCDL